MRGIRKAFPGVVALDGVDLEVRAGEVHVLLGENGAGKSTLMKVLSGASGRDAGSIELEGRPVEIDSPGRAHSLGVRIIYQELNLVPELSAAENIFLGWERRTGLGLVDRARQRREARELFEGLGVAIDPDAPVRRLGIAQQQMVEVAKALADEARVLVMDEPTSALTDSEIASLFLTIERLTARGVAVVYISHRLDEVERIGRRVTVLRDGRNVATRDVGAASRAELVRLMAGRDVAAHYPRRPGAPGAELLRAEGLCRRPAFADVSFLLRRGEVLGIAGLVGAGRTELARALAGADRLDSGTVLLRGEAVRLRGPRDAIRRGLGLLPEDRKTQGLVLGLAVSRNLALPSAPRLCRFGVVSRTAEDALARRQVDDLRIKTPSLAQRVALLSGGNQQKVVLGKWLAADVEVLIMDEPTRGIDVGAKQEIYELMNRLTAAGAGIVMISSELPEVLGMSDRILVLRRGRVAAEMNAAEATQERVLSAALGHAS
ncbi:MAG TPA: sugar ABC transporter ATP-binding protein [Vicinamibacteria bacterium]|nr:sugar ABC transporter ATP-binding protein [Vicinamibacteria bacterium]